MANTQVFLINIDVDDLEAGTRFYTQALDLTVGRRFSERWVELVGGSALIYLLEKAPGSDPTPRSAARDYARHWTPIHFDFIVPDLAAAVARCVAAGAGVERPIADEPYGRIAMLADPFGHGFCLIEFNAEGYDAPQLH